MFGGDQALIDYIQRVFGYSISGDCGEAILPIALGGGENGKSTIWNPIIEIMGDYGYVAPESLIMGDGQEHPTSMASLMGKRVVCVQEPQKGVRLNEARVKDLTGDQVVTARRMREDFWTFRRTHTFWISIEPPTHNFGHRRWNLATSQTGPVRDQAENRARRRLPGEYAEVALRKRVCRDSQLADRRERGVLA